MLLSYLSAAAPGCTDLTTDNKNIFPKTSTYVTIDAKHAFIISESPCIQHKSF